jgi:hypothetical protein
MQSDASPSSKTAYVRLDKKLCIQVFVLPYIPGVPTDWRTVHVSPIYKKGSKYSPEKYRPISLTCICCKIMEHVVVSAILTHTDKHNILPLLPVKQPMYD